MRLGFYTECLNRKQTGIEKVTSSLIAELLKRGEKLTLFHSSNRRHPRFKEAEHHLFRSPLNFPFSRTVTALFHTSSFDTVDLLHFTTPQMLYAKRPKVPIVLHAHDLTPLLYPEYHNIKNVLFFKYLYKKYVKDADALIAVSERTKKDFVTHLNVPKEKVVVIPPVFGYTPQKIATKREPLILYLGTLEPRKNVVGLLKAFALLKKQKIPHKLVLAGKKGWDYDAIFDTIEDLNLKKEVSHLGYVSAKKREELYKKAEVFVYPSFYEGFGLPILEAMSYGTPVVASKTSSMPEVVGEGGVLVNPKSPKAIAKGIASILLGDQKQWQKKAHAQAHTFSSNEMVDKTVALYHDLLNKPPKRN